MTVPTITPKDWGEFQHYKDRKPAWIKLHRSLLDNYDFHRLPVASRALAPCLWLLASEYEGGQMPADFDMIAFRLRMSADEVREAISPLIETGFFVASSMLAGCYQVAILEKERETELETEKDSRPSDSSAKADRIPYQAIADTYNDVCGDLFPRVAKLTDQRKRSIAKAWRLDRDNPDESLRTDSVDYWRRYFTACTRRGFFQRAASGEAKGEHAGWRPDFDFLVKQTTWLGMREGKYQ